MIFFDTSALVKAYVPEAGTPTIRAALRRLNGRLALSSYVALEVLATLGKQLRSRHLGKKEHQNARADFFQDFSAFKLVEIHDPVLQNAYVLADRHRDLSVSAMDILHVASALEFQRTLGRKPLIVVSADQGFLALAQACGLRTFNPETQPFGNLLAFYGWHGAN